MKLKQPSFTLWLVAVLVLLSGCTRKVSLNSLQKAGNATDSSSADEQNVVNQDDGSPQPEGYEKIDPPQQITGSYLVCLDQNSREQNSQEKTTLCALRDEKTQNNVDMEASFASYSWKFLTSHGASAQVTVLPAGSAFHAEYKIKSATGSLETSASDFRFVLDVVTRSGQMQTAQTENLNLTISWVSSNGAVAPSTAIVSGSEGGFARNNYLCRLHLEGIIVPGKLISREVGEFSICYAAYAGELIMGNNPSNGSLAYLSDILVTDSRSGDQNNLLWIRADGQQNPNLRFVGGWGEMGQPLFTCRSANPRDAAFEPTAGYLNDSGNLCIFELGGPQATPTFEVLSWKTSELKLLFEAKYPK